MLLSRKHRFIFIHIYKTAGSSIRAALRPLAADPSQIRASPPSRLLRAKHRTLASPRQGARATEDAKPSVEWNRGRTPYKYRIL
jgi:hypothetical protein